MDNATRKELLYKARAVGYPGSILDVFANYDQGKDLIAEFQQQQQMQQTQQMSDMAAQQSGMQPQQQMQQPQQQMQPQVPQMPVVPSSPTPAPNFTPPQPPAPIGVQSQNTPMGIVSGQSGPNQGRAIFKEGGFKEKNPPTEPIYVYSKNDPAYKKYLRDLEYYNKQKAIYQDIGERAYYTTYDELVEQAYKNAAAYNTQFDPNVGLTYSNSDGGYAFKKPTPVILEKESNPKAIDIKPLPTPSLVDLKSVITKLPIPQSNKQRVVINTPQGDKIRVQDAKTKRFINWEDEKGLPSDVENPTGTPNDFKFATGGFTTGGPGNPLKTNTNIATAADSSFIANRASNVDNFYKNSGYDLFNTVSGKNAFEELARAREAFKTKGISSVDASNPNIQLSYDDYTNYKPGATRFEQYEITYPAINRDIARPVYDTRINPQYIKTYEGGNMGIMGETAEVAVYDKLAVTPWSKLSDEQKLKRLQKFGSSGTPFNGQTKEKAIESFKNPMPVRLDMKEAKGFPMPEVEIKPQITNLPIPETKKQRVTINTSQGDKVRVQDIKTKKFLGWEDVSGESLDFENYKPTGNAEEDFPQMKVMKTAAFKSGGFKEKKCYTCVGRKRRV